MRASRACSESFCRASPVSRPPLLHSLACVPEPESVGSCKALLAMHASGVSQEAALRERHSAAGEQPLTTLRCQSVAGQPVAQCVWQRAWIAQPETAPRTQGSHQLPCAPCP